MPQQGSPGSGIEDAQRTRVVIDAIVQAGLSARIAFSLAAGLAGHASRSDDEQLMELAERAQQAAEGAKNADMSLDLALADDDRDAASALRDASTALDRASETFEVAAEIHERLDAVEAAASQGT